MADILPFVPQFLNLAISIGVGVYAWFASRQKDHEDDIAAINTRIGALEQAHADRITELESDMRSVSEALKHLPDQESVHRVELQVERLGGQLNSVAKSVESIDRMAQRIDDFLREASRAN